MNLYFRLLWMVLRLWFRPGAVSLTEPFRRSFRVLPTDCDFNLHLTNSRYFALIDVARVEQLARLKLIGPLLKKRWLPFLNASEITFIRPLPPLKQFDIVTRIVTWDDKYLYIEQRFETPGILHAVSLGRAAFVHGRELVPPAQVAAMAGHSGEAPASPAVIDGWHVLLKEKKEHFAQEP